MAAKINWQTKLRHCHRMYISRKSCYLLHNCKNNLYGKSTANEVMELEHYGLYGRRTCNKLCSSSYDPVDRRKCGQLLNSTVDEFCSQRESLAKFSNSRVWDKVPGTSIVPTLTVRSRLPISPYKLYDTEQEAIVPKTSSLDSFGRFDRIPTCDRPDRQMCLASTALA